MLAYQDFLSSKSLIVPDAGLQIEPDELNSNLFPFQRDLTLWALRKGKAALFADTGLGKSRMALAWAEALVKIGRKVLILAPLAVTSQFVSEGLKMGIAVRAIRSNAEIGDNRIVTCNYEIFERLDLTQFGGVVLDESSILKSFEGKTRTALIKAFALTPYRLCCTATPAPNDIQEICNHAEFLGVMNRNEMLAAFFVHDDSGWRLKGHAARGPFWKWLASWAMSVKFPSDLGYSDEGYQLPGLDIQPALVKTSYVPEGKLFADKLSGVTERAAARKATITDRVEEAVRIVNQEPGEQWLIWCAFDNEDKALQKALPGAVSVKGSDSPEYKAKMLLGFAAGEVQILISKPSIAGFGMNFQRCARMVFCGIGDSYEQYYQAIRRCYRFGQEREVKVYIVLSEVEQEIYYNVLRKEKEAARLTSELVKHLAEFEQAQIKKTGRETRMYKAGEASGQNWKMMLGDSAERMKEIPDKSIDLSVFSPPFGSLYTYSDSDRDIGNCKDGQEFWQHFSFVSKELLRITKPGRNVCVHVAQIPLQKAKDGVIGLSDFRGETIKHFVETGFIYHGEVCIDKDPQAQAIRTKSKALLFTQFHKDASWSRPALADYILLFRAPGDNAVPINPDVTNNEWIEWARPIWYGIKETETLNVVEARSEEDERHICPLQLGTIERCIRLWSNPGETVFSPFGGIGSEPYMAVKLGRYGLACELKEEYWKVAVKNLKEAERQANAGTLWDLLPADEEEALAV
jgi:DNA modification methylase